jgi:hypothetical protein
VPTVTLEGLIQSTITATTTGAARVVSIEQGAGVQTVRNTRRLEARSPDLPATPWSCRTARARSAWCENTGVMLAFHQPASGEAVTGRNIAVDVSTSTNAVTVRQSGVTDGDDLGDNIADPDADKDGVDDADEPSITGDILFGSGADRLEALNGEVLGAIAFGAGADTLLIDGGARVAGNVTDSDGRLAIDLRRGVLELTNGQTLQASSLAVGAQSSLLVTLNPAASGPLLDISGAASFASGSRLGIRLTSLIQGPQRFQVVRAGSLNASGLNASLEQDTPFLFVSSLAVDSAANTINVDVRRRTAAEAGLNRAQGGAFDAVYDALGRDATLRDAFLARTSRQGLLELYEQILPEHAGGALYALASGGEALSRAIRDRPARGVGPDGAWVQEVGYYVSRDAGEDSGFDGRGFGLMGGVETAAFGGAVGLSAALMNAEIEEPTSGVSESLSATVFEGGLYWRGDFGGLTTSVRGAVGWANFNSERQFVSASAGIDRSANADWNGLTATAHAGAAYRAEFGRFFVRPEVSVDAPQPA